MTDLVTHRQALLLEDCSCRPGRLCTRCVGLRGIDNKVYEITTLTTALDNALAEVQRLNGLIIHLEATIKADNAQVTEDYEAGSSAMKAAASEIERLKSESAERISLITDLAAYIQTTCPNGSWWVASLADRVDEMENEAYGDGNSQIEAKP